MKQTFSIRVRGKVQGVFYRQSTMQKALQLGISGYVQNIPDGTVYIKATGTTEQIEQLLAWCKQGPPLAQVTGVDCERVAYEDFNGFTIRRG